MLDRQNYKFSNWPVAESDSVTKCIINHQKLFPSICNSSKFIENRIKEAGVEQLPEDAEQVLED